MRFSFLAASLAITAGAAVSVAQPTIDGQRAADAQYVQRWLQNRLTSFGDNRSDLCASAGAGVRVALNNSNTAGVDGSNGGASSGAGVTTGVEIAIPLAQLGNPTGDIRICAFVNGGGYDYLSNQVSGSLPAAQANLGGDGTGDIGGLTPVAGINFNNFSGDQFVTVTNTVATDIGAVTIDGTVDGAYGAAIWTQTLGTGFGDSNLGLVDQANGSELDGIFAKVVTATVDGGAPGPYLLIVLAGNMQGDGGTYNKLCVFIDSGDAGGQNVLTNTNPGAEGLNTQAGLTFDSGFKASYYVSVRAGGGPVTMYTDFAKLNPGGGGGYLGRRLPPNAVVGVGSACPPNDSIAVGSELDGIYSYLDKATRKLYIFASGNVKADEYLHLFFDLNGNPAGDKGQHAVGVSGLDDATLVDNVQIGIPDHLHKFAADGVSAGLTFENNFYADYWVGAHFENVTRMALDSAILRNEGKQFYPFSAIGLDYGSYSAGEVNTIVPMDGTSASGGPTANPPGINLQDGAQANIFSGFAPRASNKTLNAFLATIVDPYSVNTPMQADWELYVGANPVPTGLIKASFRNNNVVGVTESSGTGAGAVTTGFEYELDLAELGWSPARTNVKMVAFIGNNDSTVISNQITGGSGQDTNLGDPKTLDLQALGGIQTITVGFCLADFNQSGSVTVQDLFSFLAAWFAKTADADFNGNPPGSGTGNVTVQDLFDYLAAYFKGPNCS